MRTVEEDGDDGSRWPLLVFPASKDAFCPIMVYSSNMATAKRAERQVRRSVTLPHKVAKQVESIAKRRALSDNRILVELIEQGIQAQKQKERDFFHLAERFRAASDPAEIKSLGDELGRFVFGE